MIQTITMMSHERHGVSQHRKPFVQQLVQTNKSAKFHITGPFDGNSPETGWFPPQRGKNAESVSTS